MLYLVAGCTLLAFFGQNCAVNRSSPTRIESLMDSEPMFGAPFACMWPGERLSASAWTGGTLIVAASLSATMFGRKQTAAAIVPETAP